MPPDVDRRSQQQRRDLDGMSKIITGAGMPHLATLIGKPMHGPWQACPTRLHSSWRDVDLLTLALTDRYLFHLENQWRYHADMAARLAEYSIGIYRHPELQGLFDELVQIVIQASGPRMDVTFSKGTHSNHAHLIYIPDKSIDDLLACEPLAPYALLSKDPAVIEPLLDHIHTIDNPQVRSATTQFSLYLAGDLRVMLADKIKERQPMLETPEHLIKGFAQTWIGQDLIQQSEQRGHDHALLDSIIKVLVARFPDLTLTEAHHHATTLITTHADNAPTQAAILTREELEK